MSDPFDFQHHQDSISVIFNIIGSILNINKKKPENKKQKNSPLPGVILTFCPRVFRVIYHSKNLFRQNGKPKPPKKLTLCMCSLFSVGTISLTSTAVFLNNHAFVCTGITEEFFSIVQFLRTNATKERSRVVH